MLSLIKVYKCQSTVIYLHIYKKSNLKRSLSIYFCTSCFVISADLFFTSLFYYYNFSYEVDSQTFFLPFRRFSWRVLFSWVFCKTQLVPGVLSILLMMTNVFFFVSHILRRLSHCILFWSVPSWSWHRVICLWSFLKILS